MRKHHLADGPLQQVVEVQLRFANEWVYRPSYRVECGRACNCFETALHMALTVRTLRAR